MEDSRIFFVRRRGRIEGPWSILKLKAEVSLHKLGKHHEISSDRIAWRRAGELAELWVSEVRHKTLAKTGAGVSHQPAAITAAPQGSAAAAEWYYCTDNNQQ